MPIMKTDWRGKSENSRRPHMATTTAVMIPAKTGSETASDFS